MTDRPLYEHRTDRGIDVFKQPDGHYEIHTEAGETFVGGTLNIGGHPAGMDTDSELYFGGDEELIIRIYADSRGDGNRLLAIGFETEAGL